MTIYLKHLGLPLLSLLAIALPSFSVNAVNAENVQTGKESIERPQTERTDSGSLLEQRIKDEKATAELPFVITPHHVNYILPLTYNSTPNMTPFTNKVIQGDSKIKDVEAKFQISLKLPLMFNVFDDNGHLFFAYTNQSYWQLYNKSASSPFRETNHSPELLMAFDNDWKIGSLTNSINSVGIVHQSNGQSGTLSRSWNRIYGSMAFDHGPLAILTKVWWRIPEREKKTPASAKGDDNPDILDYMGNFEFNTAYGLEKHRFNMMLRNNLKSPNRGAVELTWSYPIIGNFRFYAQYFNGYGESLIDYNDNTNRLGIGVSINDIF